MYETSGPKDPVKYEGTINQTFGKFKRVEKENENYEKIRYFK